MIRSSQIGYFKNKLITLYYICVYIVSYFAIFKRNDVSAIVNVVNVCSMIDRKGGRK